MTDLLPRLRAALGGTYAFERELGGGGMSRVFTATESALGRTVVVKVVAPELAEGVSAERFAREIQVAASLQQANIVPLLAAGDADGLPYYTMPYVDGESLRGRLAKGPPLTVPEAVGILRDVARALSFAHARGVVHRDIKPDNVLLSHGTAMVTDFGIAKAVSASRTRGDNSNSDTLTQAGTSIGTPSYMAPEQIAGDPAIDQRVDLYAWGCMAYELLVGEPPFVRPSPQRLLAAHLSESPVDIATRRADLPPALARLVMRCLAKDPNERPATADELLRELDTVFTPNAIAAPRPKRRGARAQERARLIGGVLGVAAAIALAFFAMRGSTNATGSTANAVELKDRSIAVLPLANLSGDKSDDYFGIGLSEEMTRALSKTGVRVIGRVSAGALAAKGLDDRAIAKELGVGSLLTGSVQRAGGQVRITVTLISAYDGSIRWTERYDRPIENVFAVQDEIAQNVAIRLLGAIGATAKPARQMETTDPEAYALFLQGQVLFNRRTAQSLRQAVSVLEQAVARDPKFARAQGVMAMSYAIMPAYRTDSTTVFHERAMAAAARALAIDSTVAEAFTAIGQVLAARNENRRADSAYTRAIALDSTVATAWGWYGLLADKLGRINEAYPRMAKARALEPAAMVVREWQAQVLMLDRRFAAADSVIREILARDSTFQLAISDRASALVGMGKGAEGVRWMEAYLKTIPAMPITESHAMLPFLRARAGDATGARAALADLKARNGGTYPAIGAVAAGLMAVGDRDAAVATLDAAIKGHDVWVGTWLNGERFDQLRRDPAGAAMLAKISAW